MEHILNRFLKVNGVFFEVPDPAVAALAEQPANAPGGMIVIHIQRLWLLFVPTEEALPFLICDHLSELSLGYAIFPLELPVPQVCSVDLPLLRSSPPFVFSLISHHASPFPDAGAAPLHAAAARWLVEVIQRLFNMTFSADLFYHGG